MKVRTLALCAGVSAPLLASAAAFAGLTGISTVSKPNPFGLLVVNVYAEFDRPGEDFLTTVKRASLSIIAVSGFYDHVPASGSGGTN